MVATLLSYVVVVVVIKQPIIFLKQQLRQLSPTISYLDQRSRTIISARINSLERLGHIINYFISSATKEVDLVAMLLSYVVVVVVIYILIVFYNCLSCLADAH